MSMTGRTTAAAGALAASGAVALAIGKHVADRDDDELEPGAVEVEITEVRDA